MTTGMTAPYDDIDEIPALVLSRSAMFDTDGPVEMVKTRCGSSHWFLLPTDMLCRDADGHPPEPGTAALAVAATDQRSGSRPGGSGPGERAR